MKALSYIIVIGCLGALVGCAALFGRSTNDPAQKLAWASELFSSKDDPVPAEKLIQEALLIYEKSNDKLGLAETYRQYGLFYRSNAVMRFGRHYRKEGFLDRSVQFETRYEKAIEYFTRSRDIFAEFKRYEALSDLSISLGKTYDLMNKREEACESFSKGLESYASYKALHAGATELLSEEMANYEGYIALMKKQAGCP